MSRSHRASNHEPDTAVELNPLFSRPGESTIGSSEACVLGGLGLVPAYPMPDGLSEITVQRIALRNGFTRDLASSFLIDLKKEVAYLDALAAPLPQSGQTRAFHH